MAKSALRFLTSRHLEIRPRDVKWSAHGSSLTMDAGPLTDVKIFVAAKSRDLRAPLASRALRR